MCDLNSIESENYAPSLFNIRFILLNISIQVVYSLNFNYKINETKYPCTLNLRFFLAFLHRISCGREFPFSLHSELLYVI